MLFSYQNLAKFAIVMGVPILERASFMIISDLHELDSFMPYLLSERGGEEVFYAIRSGDGFGAYPFEFLYGNETSLTLPKGKLNFDLLLSSSNNYLNLEQFISKTEVYEAIGLLEKSRGSCCFEFPLILSGRRYLYACSVYSWPEKKAYVVCLRRLKILEQYLSEYSNRTRHDFTTALLNKESCLTLVNAIKPNDRLVLVFADLSNFKLVNDVYGHIMGDKILRAFADCLMKEKPANASLYRFGGDEFIAILPGFDEAMTKDYLERCDANFANGGNFGLPISFSAGCCPMFPKIKASLYLIRCADKAMYLAKKKDIPFYILSEQEALDIIEEDKKSNG
jgi:diguanylate cyclase (GGDEF)-like protein